MLGERQQSTTLVADDGGENTASNDAVAHALQRAEMSMSIAQTDIVASNSMIERFWACMRHSFLFTKRLDSLPALRRFVDYHVDQHNTFIPHNAFQGHTPATGLQRDRAIQRGSNVTEQFRAPT